MSTLRRARSPARLAPAYRPTLGARLRGVFNGSARVLESGTIPSWVPRRGLAVLQGGGAHGFGIVDEVEEGSRDLGLLLVAVDLSQRAAPLVPGQQWARIALVG